MKKHLNRASAFVAGFAALILAAGAWAHSLTVPHFRDDGDLIVNGSTGAGTAAFISIKNTTDQPLTVYIVYDIPDNDGQVIPQAAAPFGLKPRQQVSWRPIRDDPIEGAGRSVPNALNGSAPEGSVQIIWIGGAENADAVVGRFMEMSSHGDMAHVLL